MISTPYFAWFGRRFKLRAAITITCQMAFILFGYDQGVFSGIVGNANFLDTFGHPSAALEGVIVSIYNLGCFTGCILTFMFCERTRRKWAMWIAMVWIVVSVVDCGVSWDEDIADECRLAALCEASKRGLLVASEPLFVGIGIVIAYWFDYGMSFVSGSIAWRLPIACQIIFALFVVVLVFGVPESPRYLYKHGRHEEALQILCDVYDGTPSNEKIAKENQEVLQVLRVKEKHGKYRWSQLLTRDKVQTGRRVLLAYGAQFMNQMGGINLVVYYITSVLQLNVSLTRNLSLLLGRVINMMFFFGSLYPTFTLDKTGRRNPMMWGSFGCGASMMMVSILLSFQPQGGDIAKKTTSASVEFFFMYMLSFGATMNCIPWVYVPEILPLHVRTKGTAVGISANWLWNFVVVMITPTLLDSLAWKDYLISMCLNFSFIPLVLFCYPETANLTLEEVDRLFYEGSVVSRSRCIGNHGWETAEGQLPDPSVLETVAGSISSKKEEGAEKRENRGT